MTDTRDDVPDDLTNGLDGGRLDARRALVNELLDTGSDLAEVRAANADEVEIVSVSETTAMPTAPATSSGSEGRTPMFIFGDFIFGFPVQCMKKRAMTTGTARLSPTSGQVEGRFLA